MSKKIIEKKLEIIDVVTVDTGETFYLEEDVYVPEELVHNKSLIRMDMNIVQFPVFSKNTKRKKNEITTYYFNKNRDTYIIVTPAAGELIPGEVEEKVFIALMKLMKDKGMNQEFLVNPSEIKEVAKIGSNNYIKEIKKSLLRLSETNYKFKNTLYSNQDNTVIKELVSTPILTFRAIELNLKANKEIRDEIGDKRIKEIYKIRISDHFYKNIVKRGYLVYDSEILLDINSPIARTLYMLLEKIRINQLYVKESVFVLIKKIPLKYEKSHLSKTIKTLTKSLNELKEKKLISDFNFIKDSTWEKSELEVFFAEKHNIIKQDRFVQDNEEVRDIYNDLLISYTEKNIENKKQLITDEMIEEIYNLLPEKAKQLKSIRKAIIDQLEKYSFEKVKASAIYLKRQKNITSPKGFFIKILENDWGKDIEKTLIEKDNSEEIKNNKSEIIEKNSFKLSDSFDEKEKFKLLEFFKSLPEEEQGKIESKTYEEYIKSSGGIENNFLNMAFNNGKNSLIAKYIKKNNLYKKDKVDMVNTSNENIDFIDKKKIPLDTDLDDEIGDIEEIKRIIEQAISLADMIGNYSFERKKEILSNILGELIPLLTFEKVTKSKLNEIMKKHIKY